MKLKKFTQKDRYGNTTSYEFEGDTKPLDPTALMKTQMEMMQQVPPMQGPPPVGGESFNMGNMMTHPGGPKGEDTIPAWLTPGEFVVNAEATEMFGPEIEAMNEVGRMAQGGKVPMYNEGGMVAYEDEYGTTPGIPPWRQNQAAMVEQLDPLLHEREGFKDYVYTDHLGKPTTGAGHLLTPEELEMTGLQAEMEPNQHWEDMKPFGEDELHEMYAMDRDRAVDAAINNVGRETWSNLSPEKQKVLASMAFQLGEKGQSKFKKLLSAIQAGDDMEVARQALTGSKGGKSLWLKQTPKRALDLAEVFHPETAAQYRNAGGQVYDDDPWVQYRNEGGWMGGLKDWIFQDNRPEEMKGGQSSMDRAPVPTFGGQDLTAAGQEQQVDPSIFPPGMVKGGGHPYADAVPGGMAPPDPYAGMDGAFTEGDISEPEQQLPAGVPPIGGAQDIPPDMGIDQFGLPQEKAPEGMGDYIPEGGSYNPFEVERENMERIAADQAVMDEAAIENQFTEPENMTDIGPETQHPMGANPGTAPPDPRETQHPMADAVGMTGSTQRAYENIINDPDAYEETRLPGETKSDWETRVRQGGVEYDPNNKPANYESTRKPGETLKDWKERIYKEQRSGNPYENATPYAMEPEDETKIGDIRSRMESIFGGRDPDPDTMTIDKDGNVTSTDPDTQAGLDLLKEAADTKAGEEGRREAQSLFQSLGLDSLFDKKELARMAVMYAGSRLLGFNHHDTLVWSARNYVNRVDAKEQGYAQLALSGKYTPESLKTFKKTGNYEDLLPVGVEPEQTGEYKDFYGPHGKVTAQKVKIGNQTVWVDGKGNQIDGTKFNADPANVKGTPEYRERSKVYINNTKDQLSSLRNQFDRFGEGDNVGYKTDINPATSAGKVAEWAHANGIEPEELSQLVESAYHEAINDQRQDGGRARDLVPYLNNLVVRQSTSNPDAFLAKDQPKEGPPVYISGQAMSELKSGAIAVMRTAGKQGDDLDMQNQFYDAVLSDWNALKPEERDKYNNSATGHLNGFYLYAKEVIDNKLGG